MAAAKSSSREQSALAWTLLNDEQAAPVALPPRSPGAAS